MEESLDRQRVRFPIAVKLTGATVAVVALVVIGLVSTTYYRTQRQYERQALTQRATEVRNLLQLGQSTAENLAHISGAALLDNDLSFIDDAVRQLVGAQNIVTHARVVRPEGRIVVTTDENGLGADIDADELKLLSALQHKAAPITRVDETHLPPLLRMAAPVELGERRLGFVEVDVTTVSVDRALAAIEVESKQATRAAVRVTLALGVLALLLGSAVAVAQSLGLSRSIRGLARVAELVGAGDLDAKAERTTSDEIGVLCDRFNEMTGRMKTLLADSMEKAALDRELDQARTIQRSLVPPETLHKLDDVQVAGLMVPATVVGGDWWQFYALPDGRVLLCVGDVTGHGIPSALLTATAKASCDTYMHGKVKEFSLAAFQETLNFAVHEAGKGELVMTLVSALIDPKKREIEVINSGHDFPMLASNGKVSSIISRGPRIGDSTDEFSSKTLRFNPNDVVVLYSDGIIEGRNAHGQPFGSRRLLRSVERHSTLASVEVARDQILYDANTFCGSVLRDDDLTLVVCRLS
ncbi:MAG: SpoIIE family protein phosphatase [Clostridia bacterium]|nr:SpoIIE family protein phosphatase [Deltaproteobacteria bacterium]